MPSSSRRYRICVVGALWPPLDGPRDSARVTEVFDFWIFLGGFCRPRHWHSLPITWFDQVIKSVLKWCGCLLSSLPCSAVFCRVHPGHPPGGSVWINSSPAATTGRAWPDSWKPHLGAVGCGEGPGPSADSLNATADPKMGQGYQAADLAGELLPCGWN